jgi:hypothetical protein
MRRKPRGGLARGTAAGVVVVRVPEAPLRVRRRLEAVRARLVVHGAAPLEELRRLVALHAPVRGGQLRRPPERDALMRQHASLALREVDLHRRRHELRRRRRVSLHPFSGRILVLSERPEADALGGARCEEQGQPSVAHRAARELRRLGGLKTLSTSKPASVQGPGPAEAWRLGNFCCRARVLTGDVNLMFQ